MHRMHQQEHKSTTSINFNIHLSNWKSAINDSDQDAQLNLNAGIDYSRSNIFCLSLHTLKKEVSRSMNLSFNINHLHKFLGISKGNGKAMNFKKGNGKAMKNQQVKNLKVNE